MIYQITFILFTLINTVSSSYQFLRNLNDGGLHNKHNMTHKEKCIVDYNESKNLIAYFNPEHSGGIDGVILMSYPNTNDPLRSLLFVNMNFENMRQNELQDKYPECSDFNSFSWHMHVSWNESTMNDSGYLDECSPMNTGGHYDPTYACGPASQYAKDPHCINVRNESEYQCDPESYQSNHISCEMGDMAGKYGKLSLDDDKHVLRIMYDNFSPQLETFNKPMYLLNDTHWNFILHLNCPERNFPRVYCAKVF